MEKPEVNYGNQNCLMKFPCITHTLIYWGCILYIVPKFYLTFSCRDSGYHGSSDCRNRVLCKLYQSKLDYLCQKYLILSFSSMYWKIYPLWPVTTTPCIKQVIASILSITYVATCWLGPWSMFNNFRCQKHAPVLYQTSQD